MAHCYCTNFLGAVFFSFFLFMVALLFLLLLFFYFFSISLWNCRMSFWVCRTIKLPLNSRCARKPSGTQLSIHLGVQCKQTTKLSAHTFHLFTLYMDLALHKCILKYRKSKHRRAQNRRRVQFRCEIAQPKWIAYMAFWTVENTKVAVFFVFYCYANRSNCKCVWTHEACRCHQWNAYWETHINVFVFILLWMFLFLIQLLDFV